MNNHTSRTEVPRTTMTVEEMYLQNIAAMLKRACEYADTLHSRTGNYADVQQEVEQLSARVNTLLATAQADERRAPARALPQSRNIS